MNAHAIRLPLNDKRRYTISDFRADVGRYHPTQFFVVGRGAYEVQHDLVWQVVLDGLSCESSRRNPYTKSPYVLAVPCMGIGLIMPSPGGRRRRDGTRGEVRLGINPRAGWSPEHYLRRKRDAK